METQFMKTERKYVKVRLKSQFHEVAEESNDALRHLAEIMMFVPENELAGEENEIEEMLKKIFRDDEESMDICTEGELYYGDGRIEVRYSEPELTEMGECVTAVSFEKDCPGLVAVMRGGDVYTALILEKGVRHACVYSAGVMPITIYTTAKKVENSLDENGGTIVLVYTVETQDGIVQFNRMQMTVTPL